MAQLVGESAAQCPTDQRIVSGDRETQQVRRVAQQALGAYP